MKMAEPINRTNPDFECDEDPRELIPELMRQFFTQGWCAGTGGGISIRKGAHIYIAPSGVQKERLWPEHLFVQLADGADVSVPECGLKKSQCTPLLINAYTLRGAGAVLHSHSKWASLITQLLPANDTQFNISHQEMIKGIKNDETGSQLRYDDTLQIPIIENTCYEADLKDSMASAMRACPAACAILVRRHGIYVWGDSWQQAKSQAECYDYLCEMGVELIRLGRPLVAPPSDWWYSCFGR